VWLLASRVWVGGEATANRRGSRVTWWQIFFRKNDHLVGDVLNLRPLPEILLLAFAHAQTGPARATLHVLWNAWARTLLPSWLISIEELGLVCRQQTEQCIILSDSWLNFKKIWQHFLGNTMMMEVCNAFQNVWEKLPDFQDPMGPGKDASNRLKLGTAFLYRAVICMHYRQLASVQRWWWIIEWQCCPSQLLLHTQWSKLGASQPRAQCISHNGISSSHTGISGSHNRTDSAPRGWPSFGISGNGRKRLVSPRCVHTRRLAAVFLAEKRLRSVRIRVMCCRL
jgi:hypothetical protein